MLGSSLMQKEDTSLNGVFGGISVSKITMTFEVDKAENITTTAPIYVSNLTSRPRVNILHPTEGTNLLGKIPVKGTIEGDNLSWVLEYAPGQYAQEGFEEIDRGTEAKGHDQQIATWDVSSLPDGQYTLRLTVTNTLTTITVTRHNLIRSP